ncbi:fungal specific transcription factor domain-containing protein [Aspergillus thermomutatus]|uniref:Xylanolytic transcriptional activator regulatory domain-containing protein n=1 Tax=Aspergillus thermomutatus TaxID=41047 RepID=A0A397HVC5_ASPTH|nr:uncharacterized protein CDV56_109449 [Aspergillus thermomutatus]RHZ67175.1 hypothetical protein CDV56_109449 [Aspergillus thermomutatus]
MHDRVAQLEKLVLSLKDCEDSSRAQHSFSAAQANHPADASQLPSTFGRISLENEETNYVEGSHWTAILDGIAELKDFFDDTDVPQPAELNTSRMGSEWNLQARRPALIFGDVQYLDRDEILASVPPRPTVDRLLATYFNSKNINTLAIHGPTFLEEYDRFWECPAKASIMWIGLLFSMICLAAIHQQLERPASDQPASLAQDFEEIHGMQVYRDRVGQCLALADYTKCVPYTIETLLHYLAIEYLNITDSQTSVWILLGITVQIALRMGYHRDGSHSSHLSPFQAEMRRRVWAIIFQLDSAAAGQYGLPRMINAGKVDTAEPRDLSDDALGPEMTELPPSRSDSAPSSIQFLVMKNRLVSTFNLVIDLTSSPKQVVSYAEVMRLDRILNEQFTSMPVPLRMRSMSRQLTDASDVILNRVFLALTFYKSRCILHREYMLAGRSDSRYLYSRRSCINAALEIQHIQASLHEESQPGRRFYHERWKYSALVKHIFLLATTILCVDLDYSIRDRNNESGITDEFSDRVVQSLTNSCSIWLQSSDKSRESQKVTEMLRIVLGKVLLLYHTTNPPTQRFQQIRCRL